MHRPGPNATQEEAHAVQVVGYDNGRQAWLIKNSWGPGFADGGFAWISFNVPSMCDPADAHGYAFIPYLSRPAPRLELTPALGRKGCYTYRGMPGDYPEKLAATFGVQVQQLLLDNLEVLQDPSSVPVNANLLLCNITSAAAAAAAAAAAPAARARVAEESRMEAPQAGPGPAPANSTSSSVTITTNSSTISINSTGTSIAATNRSSATTAAASNITSPTSSSSSAADEVGVLMSIKRVLDPSGAALKDWQLESTTPCGWTGITCDKASGRVSIIDMWDEDKSAARVKLTGQLPPGDLLRRLSALVCLCLRGTEGLAGTLPEDWLLLKGLQNLRLNGNKFSGEDTDKPHMCWKVQVRWLS
jgi:hypothetical protein